MISYETACVLAGSPPWEMEANVLVPLYRRREDVRARGERPMQRQFVQHLSQFREVLVVEWREKLSCPTAGIIEGIEAIQPVLVEWLGRRYGFLPPDNKGALETWLRSRSTCVA